MNARIIRAGPVGGSESGGVAPRRVAPNGPFSALRALWTFIGRASILWRASQAQDFAGGLVELDDRLLKDLGYLRSDVVGMATRRMSAGETVRYRDEF